MVTCYLGNNGFIVCFSSCHMKFLHYLHCRLLLWQCAMNISVFILYKRSTLPYLLLFYLYNCANLMTLGNLYLLSAFRPCYLFTYLFHEYSCLFGVSTWIYYYYQALMSLHAFHWQLCWINMMVTSSILW